MRNLGLALSGALTWIAAFGALGLVSYLGAKLSGVTIGAMDFQAKTDFITFTWGGMCIVMVILFIAFLYLLIFVPM